MAMLSRVAEHLYWMSRYAERAENTARLISANANLILDLPRAARPGWISLIAITGNGESFEQRYARDASEANVLSFMIGDAENSGSILSSLGYARENARTIRDTLPREAWEQINSVYLLAKHKLQMGISPQHRFNYLRDVAQGVQQLVGILAGSMSHDAGYEFVRLGRNIERADMTTRIVDVRCEDLRPQSADALAPFENLFWMSVLRSIAAYQMYRRHRQVAVRRNDVVSYLFKDHAFPRSFYYCLKETRACLLRLPVCEGAQDSVTDLLRLMDQANPETLDNEQLHAFIDELQIYLGEIHIGLGRCYFGYGASAS